MYTSSHLGMHPSPSPSVSIRAQCIACCRRGKRIVMNGSISISISISSQLQMCLQMQRNNNICARAPSKREV